MSWISVEESKPDWGFIIVFSEYGVGFADYNAHDGVYNFAYFNDGSQHSDPKITHWMPLPEPPVN